MSTLKKNVSHISVIMKNFEKQSYSVDGIRNMKVVIQSPNTLLLQVTTSPVFFADEPFLSRVCLIFSVTMGMNSSVNDFILYELARDALREKVVFVILLVYLTTLLASFLIVMTLRHSQTLGNPTYFLLFCFSFADSCLSTTTAPRLIVDSIPEKKFISYNECMTQIFASHVFGCMEILVLTLMSFDHYVVILSP